MAMALIFGSAVASAQSAEPPELPEAVAAYQAGNFKRALTLWQTACDAGNPRGCYHAAVVHRDGEGVAADFERALALFNQACDGQFATACFNLAIYSEGQERIRYFERGCELNDVGSCARLGMAYRDGDTVDSDASKAVAFLERACLTPDMQAGPACFLLANLYDAHSETMLFDDHTASNRWLDEGCARNDPDSCQNLAWHYAHGFGLDTDFVRSAALYQLACGDNAGMECFFVPSRHRASPRYSGRDVESDWREAGGAYDVACKEGLAHGCFALARLISRGGKGARHADRMRELLNRAIALDPDHVSAIELLRRVNSGELPTRPVR